MDKDSTKRHYRDYEGLKAANNGNTSSLKRSSEHCETHSRQIRCLCLGGLSDKASQHSFFKGFMINLGICALVVAYTLLGSFIFLYLEGGSDNMFQRTLATTSGNTNSNNNQHHHRWNSTASSKQSHEARARTVENIWKITENLNVLYRDNWTKLAAQEIEQFQEQLVKRVKEEMIASQNAAGTYTTVIQEHEWNFAKAFLYSLTVLTTIGCGSVTPRSSWGKGAAIGYAILGIPLTLFYLSSSGGFLSRCARGVFTRALCCCLCSNCGYCCYDERRMQEKERRMRKKRQQEELAQQQQQAQLQEPFYVRANASTFPSTMEIKTSPKDEISSLGSGDRPNVTVLAPIGICLGAIVCYILAGVIALHRLEGWSYSDGVYFCFMSLSTIGFGDVVPGSYPQYNLADSRNATVWFCSCYIMLGMAVTAMCFNIIHDEIVHRQTHRTDKQEAIKPSSSVDELATDPFALTS